MAKRRSSFVSVVLLAALLVMGLSHCQELDMITETKATATEDPKCNREGFRMVFEARPTEDGETDSQFQVNLERLDYNREDLEKPEVTVTQKVVEQGGQNFTVVHARIIFVIPPRGRYIMKPTGHYKFHNTDKYPADITKECSKEEAAVAYPITVDEANDISDIVNQHSEEIMYIWIGVRKNANGPSLFVSHAGKDVSFNNDMQWEKERSEKGDCIAFVPKNKTLIDLYCDSELPFVCKKDIAK